MSHPNNEKYLEESKTKFEYGTLREKVAIITELRDRGFEKEAEILKEILENTSPVKTEVEMEDDWFNRGTNIPAGYNNEGESYGSEKL